MWILHGRFYWIFVTWYDIVFVSDFWTWTQPSPQEMASQQRPEGRSSLCFITLNSDNTNRYPLFAQGLHITRSNRGSHCHLTTPTQLTYQAKLQANKPSTVKHHWCFQCLSSTSAGLCWIWSPRWHPKCPPLFWSASALSFGGCAQWVGLFST